MNFILYSDVNDRSISQSLGQPEYSYYFVLKAYRPVLESLGRVHVVSTVAEVDPLYRQLSATGEDCLFLSFTPPQNTATDLACPTLCVVAWEFDSIPDEQWDNDPRQNWTHLLARQGRVITLSSHTARAIRKVMGEDFPVLVLPTPVWDNYAVIRARHRPVAVNPGTVLEVKGCLLDSRNLILSADALIEPPLTEEQQAALDAVRPPPLTFKRRFVIARHFLRLWALDLGHEQAIPVHRTHFLSRWYWEGLRDLFSDRNHARIAQYLPAIAGPQSLLAHKPPPMELPQVGGQARTQVEGVVYVTVFNPLDGRKNWHQLISAFCWAFRDTADATLVLKITQNDLSAYYAELMGLLAQLAPFACRVLVMHGYLDDPQYARLYQAASFYVNASRGEGLCLPLMEFMACGKPAIAPNHTAMEDYIDEDVAFIVACSEELTAWPQDTRVLLRTRRHRPDWGSLKRAYEDSYRLAKSQPEAYQRMSAAAIERMRGYCAFAPVQQRLVEFFKLVPRPSTPAAVTDDASC